MAIARDYFELRRRIDDLIYQFDRKKHPNGLTGYKRRDRDLWVLHHKDYGWVAWDGESNVIGGRPWYVLAQEQVDYPPEGVWVSMKEKKSYVYDLVYGVEE